MARKRSLLGRECKAHGLSYCSQCPPLGKPRGLSGGLESRGESVDDWSLERLVGSQRSGDVPGNSRFYKHEIVLSSVSEGYLDGKSFRDWELARDLIGGL